MPDTISSPSIAEGNAGVTPLNFTFTRNSAATSQNYTYSFSPGTASQGSDYSGTTGSFTLAAGVTNTTIAAQIFGDTAFELNETFTLQVFEVGNAVALATGTGTINNDDTAPTLSINDVTLDEGSGGGATNFTFTVTRNGDNSVAASATYTVTNLGTTSAADFSGGQPAAGTVNFAAGQSTQTIVIPILADTIVEGNEQFRVTLSAPMNATIAQGVGTGTIVDDDSSFAIAGVTMAEGTSATATAFNFVVTRSGSTAGSATLNFTVANGTTDSADFASGTTGTVTFNSGATTANAVVQVAADSVVEGTENFTVTLTSTTSGTITTAAATGTINDDDTAGTVSINPGSIVVTEGDSGQTFATVTLERTGGNAAFTVDLSTVDNTATSNVDYVPFTNQTVTFGAGVNQVTVQVGILGDLLLENPESFNLLLSNPTSGVALGSNGTVTIADNDTVGSVTIGSVDISEGNGGATAMLTVTRSGGGAAFTVDYATAAGSATAGTDFIATSGTLTFVAGQTTATISIPIVGDTVVEPDESFSVNLTNLSGNGTLIFGQGTVRIINDDGLPTPPGGSTGPVQQGSTVFVSADYVQPADSTATTISTLNNSGTNPINITSNAAAQTVVGNYGNNVLNSTGGADTFNGLLGNDTYIVNDSNVVVVENANEGSDTVQASVSYFLPTNAEVESLSTTDAAGTAAINLTGSVTSQTITGNAGDNIINGFGGADTMVGLGGNDTFLVRGPGDIVIEGNGGGNDTVFTTVSYSLGVNEVERLSTVVQADTAPINLIGNFATQVIIGNYGNNVLNGGSGGIDTLIGLFGDDTYAVGDSRTDVFENAGEGNDTVVTSVDYALDPGVSIEVLAVQNRAGTNAINLFGNELAQTIAGNDGANYIDGGAGADALIGGGGGDRFAFTTALGNGNVDTISDFQVGTDVISLFTGVFAGVSGGVTATNFTTGTAATTADQRIIYNQANGQIFYDADGSGVGAAILFAVVSAGLPLTAASFEIIA